MDFAVWEDHQVKLKEHEKEISTKILQENWKNYCDMKVTLIPIVIGALGTVTKELLKRQEDLEIKGQHYWHWPEYWEESWSLEETCCHSNFSSRPSANARVEKLSKEYNDNNYNNCLEFSDINRSTNPG